MAQQDLSPQIGEVIKIQFSVPGSQQMACYAVVIRIEKINQFDNMIGVHFYKLDRSQRLNLVQGLAEKVQKNMLPENYTQNKMNTIISISGLIITLLCWLTLMKIYFFK